MSDQPRRFCPACKSCQVLWRLMNLGDQNPCRCDDCGFTGIVADLQTKAEIQAIGRSKGQPLCSVCEHPFAPDERRKSYCSCYTHMCALCCRCVDDERDEDDEE